MPNDTHEQSRNHIPPRSVITDAFDEFVQLAPPRLAEEKYPLGLGGRFPYNIVTHFHRDEVAASASAYPPRLYM